MKKTVTKYLCLALALVMCLALFACTSELNQQGTGNAPANPVTGATDPTTGSTGSDNNGSEEPQNGEIAGEIVTGGGAEEGFLDNVEGLPEALANPNITIVYWYNPKQYAVDIRK